jgi:dihydrofolate synthase/folylpolyglutamate synthase
LTSDAGGSGRPDGPLERLYARRPAVIKPGLERMLAGQRALGGLGLERPAVLVGGTNGKGTTSSYLWQLLAGLGVRTGLFTSPHLVRFSERIRTNVARVDDQRLIEVLAALERDLPPAVAAPLSFFELNTLIALRVFQQDDCEVSVVEVGLGGRWDSTNVLEPRLSVIASIGLDHQRFLGDTTAAIAREKAGIMRRGRPTLWGGDDAGDADAIAALRAEADERGALLLEGGRAFGLEAGHVFARLPDRPPLRIALPEPLAAAPAFLRGNFAKAMAAFWLLLGDDATAAARRRAGVDGEAAVALALARLAAGAVPTPPSLRARFERVQCHVAGAPRAFLLDVGHNVDGVRALAAALRESGLTAPGAGPRPPALVSILGDKDVDAILDVLRSVLDPIALFPVAAERTWTRAQLASRHRDLRWHGSFAEALADGEVAAASVRTGRPTVVCGSVLALGEVAATLRLTVD